VSDNNPFVNIEYLPVADNTVVTGDASAITQAGKLVALDDTGKINRYFVPYSLLSVTSLAIDDGDPITGDVRLYGSGTVTVTRTGNTFYFSPNFQPGVLGLTVSGTTLTGSIALLPGAGLDLSVDAFTNSVTFTNTGVLSINGLKENILLEGASGISVTSLGSSTIALSVSNLQWSQFDSTVAATTQRVITQDGVYLGTDNFASLYQFDTQTVVRGISGVKFVDPVTLTDAIISGGNGLYLNSSRIQDVSGILYFAPSSGAVVFPSGTSLLNVTAIQPSFSTGVTLVANPSDPTFYSATVAHNYNLYPLSLMVTQESIDGSGTVTQSTKGIGANTDTTYGYSVSFTKNTFTIQARLSGTFVAPYPKFNISCMFASETAIAPLPAASSITAAPIQPLITLVGVPTGGGFAETDILLSTRPVENATSYLWERVDESLYWETVTPLLSTSTDPSFIVSRPGKFLHRVRGKNSAGPSTSAIDFYITIRPAAPILAGPVVDIQDMGVLFYKKATITLTYQAGSIRVIDTISNQEIQLETPIIYTPPSSSVGEYTPRVTQQVVLTNLLPNSYYTLIAQAYLDSEIFSDFSAPLEIYIPS
jgi:hypothetical protein